ncbi:5'/3'-nucleotidase SurE [Halorarum salinum]|uniref:5'-nucleotidase SurE n=1 Tax=Halorarum salinum TaxID=2743089 RepID=A0A7D5L9M6_9EURY|nr:5'/3'-nucleotidase SurE [Halobaculum salinum]QLG60969.1 5'/3'-nucleotidase SurE [Halobaculum salinum]
MTRPHVLLTNDDGIDSPGLAALYEELRAVADVTVVAPADNQSGVGRSRSRAVDVDDHEWGYAVHGTPADCAAYALRGLEESFDLVVSGCNLGPNCGEYLIGHSGTVGAAVEAAYLGAPALAVSAYHRADFFPPDGITFDVPATVTRELVERLPGSGVFDAADYLGLNAPLEAHGDLRVTEPLADYDVEVREATADEREQHEGAIRLESDYWDRLDQPDRYPTLERVAEPYPAWSDRAAVVDGDVSLSALSIPQEPVHAHAIDDLVATYNAEVSVRAPAADDD